MAAHVNPSRRIFIGAGLGGALLALTGCGGRTGDVPAGTAPAQGSTGGGAGSKLKVFGAYATPIEEPWDGVIHQALQKVADEGLITYTHSDNIGYDGGMERILRDVCNTDKPAIIFGDAFGNEDPTRAVAKDFPDVAFAFGSGEEEVAPNYSVFDNWIHDPAYLAGMLCGGMTKSNVLGVVGGLPVPEVNRIVNAFIKGAQEVNPKVSVKVTFINSWFDPAKAKQAALAQVAAGADVLFAERAGVIEAAKEKGLLSIGCMGDQKEQAPESVMASVTWNMEPTVRAVIEAVQSGTFSASNLKDHSFMKNGGSDLTEVNTAVAGGIPQDLVGRVAARKAEMKSGAFTTPVIETTPAGSVELS
ncbi:BMP family protein [Intrasporangium calvum]|uniref:BMP family protein n=1 Tax=Intrasporangium calvum TaxID=53358 RepID=A0ABT5GE76_9MICO|nr:BMP family protein [Intrasporangium calvum]MDC5696548.1 BMP family protein [Intrasporangium calvum]